MSGIKKWWCENFRGGHVMGGSLGLCVNCGTFITGETYEVQYQRTMRFVKEYKQ